MGKEDVIPHSEFSVGSDYDGTMDMSCLESGCDWGYGYDYYTRESADFSLSNLNRVAAIHTRAPFEYTVENKCPGSFHIAIFEGGDPDFVGMMNQKCALCREPFMEHP